MNEEELKLAQQIANKLDVDLVLVTKEYEKFAGHKCTCGYFLEEGDYQFKGRDDDFVDYICEKCGYIVRLYLYKLPKEV